MNVSKRCASALVMALLASTFVAQAATFELHQKPKNRIEIKQGALYPEGIEYSKSRDAFLVGSIRKGIVLSVSKDGQSEVLIDDDRLKQVVGIRVDEDRGRILVNSSDYGVGEKTGRLVKNFSHAALGVYDLQTGAPIQFINLENLRNAEKRFVNDLDLDKDGNAYITDSLSAAIYKVTPAGDASVFITNEAFRGQGFNLNGIQVHPSGFLLVAKKSDGRIFKIPLTQPERFSEVQLPQALVGTDGLYLNRGNTLIAVTNRASGQVSNTIYQLSSVDNWKSAKIVKKLKVADAYPTTAAMANNKLFVNLGYLHTLPNAIKEDNLRKSFSLIEVGQLNE